MTTLRTPVIVGVVFLTVYARTNGETRSDGPAHVAAQVSGTGRATINDQSTVPRDGDPTHEATTADVPGLTAAESHCAIAGDPSYGITPENPVKLGGVLHPAWREIVYLLALRGPSGKGLHFLRRGSTMAGGNILDVYAIEYTGLQHPLTLFVDGYLRCRT